MLYQWSPVRVSQAYEVMIASIDFIVNTFHKL